MIEELCAGNHGNIAIDGGISFQILQKTKSLAGAETAIGASNQALKYANTVKRTTSARLRCSAFSLICARNMQILSE